MALPDCFSHFGGVFSRIFRMRAGGPGHFGHAHKIDHVTMLFVGTIRLTVRESESGPVIRQAEYSAPSIIEVPAHEWHQVEPITDCEYACVFANPDAPENGDLWYTT